MSEEIMDLVDCKKELQFNQHDMHQQLERDRSLLQKLSTEIRQISRKNFELERGVSVLAKQITLLTNNMITISELNDMTGGIFIKTTTQQIQQYSSPLSDKKKKIYERLFSILQQEPKYMASLSKHVRAKEAYDYVKTVVIDIYGDQYDSHQEQLLLKLFQMTLKVYFNETLEISLSLRENTYITQMLKTYTLRAQSLSVLYEILGKPIREMIAQTVLNCEINPCEVYKQIINSYEAKMNKPWDGTRNPTSEEAANNKYVKRLIPPRVKQLEYIATHFIQRIIEKVDSIPFGIKWICRQLAEIAQKRFPHANQYQINGLIGRYIYFKFYNPILIAPETIRIVDTKLSKTMTRNLILIAKILKRCFTGDPFREHFMQKLSNFVERHRQDIQTYFARLTDIDPLQNRPDVDNLLETTLKTSECLKKDTVIQLSLKQIGLIHQLLLKHTNAWNPDNTEDDPVWKILNELGAAPDNDVANASMNINMKLLSMDKIDDDEKKESNITLATIFEPLSHDPFVNNIYSRIQNVLLNERIPQTLFDEYRNSLKQFLYHVRDWAQNNKNSIILTDTEGIMNHINKYLSTEVDIEKDSNGGFNNLLIVYVNQVCEMKKRINRFHLKVINIAKARDTLVDRANYLHKTLQHYQGYKTNINKKPKANGCKKRIKKQRYTHQNLEYLVSGYLKQHLSQELIAKYPLPLNNIFVEYLKIAINSKPIKLRHKELCLQKLIIDVDEFVLKQTKANFNNFMYYFVQIGPEEFELEIKYRVGFGAKISPFPEPFHISMSKLLEMKEAHQSRYEVEIVTFNVNKLIYLLKRSFDNKIFCLL